MLVTLPLIPGFALQHTLDDDQAIPLQPSKVIAIVIAPVAIGMFIRARQPEFADRFDRPERIASTVLLVLVIAAALFDERENIVTFVKQVGLAALTFNVVSLLVGHFVPRLLRIERRQSIAIGMEIGIHNAVLVIAIAVNVLGNRNIAIPPAVHTIISLFTAAAFGYLVSRRRVDESWATTGSRIERQLATLRGVDGGFSGAHRGLDTARWPGRFREDRSEGEHAEMGRKGDPCVSVCGRA